MTVLVGAYAAAPRPITSDAQFRAFVDDVRALPGVSGLEIPFRAGEPRWSSPGYLAGGDPDQRHVLTMIPAFVGGLAQQPRLGLASRDAAARQDALDLVREARDWMAESGAEFSGIELHSSPPAGLADAGAFADSLAEITSWDWRGVDLLIEHCDALVPDHDPAKGYLPLSVELDLARRHDLGLVINWGRSAIETRSADGAGQQIETAEATGRLRGIVFSGCAAVTTDLGGPWGDVHLPVRDWAAGTALRGTPFEQASADSLLSIAAIDAALAKAPGAFAGVKVAPSPSASDVERVALVAAHVALVTAAQERAAAAR